MTGPIKRGLLWQQRDRIFSRWKERYFVLTRDYLHCFKRASGSANERASDMGQFIFKVKLVDVEKVEWLNRRSYSAIGLMLGREGRVLLRCDEGLEDWFELLEACTLTSKERRKALKIAQAPRSRASLAAPVSHASLQSSHFLLGGTYSSALDDWLMTNATTMGKVRRQNVVTNNMWSSSGRNPFLFSDSVPDLSILNNENHNHISGLSTNHSTPQKIPYSASNGSSRYSNSCTSQNISFSNCNGLLGSPRRILVNSDFGSTNIVDEESEDCEVELRRPHVFRQLSTENGNKLDRDWLYHKPNAPKDMRHSVQPMLPTNNTSLNQHISDLDCSANDSSLYAPHSTHRPSSYREPSRNKINASTLVSDFKQNSVSSLGTILDSPGCSFKIKQVPKQQHASNLNQSKNMYGSHYNTQEYILKMRNKEEHCASTKSSNRVNCNELHDSNQNRYNKSYNQYTKMQYFNSDNRQVQHQHQVANLNINDCTANNNNSNAVNGNVENGSGFFRERYQHPALAAIINDDQGIKSRDRSSADYHQISPRCSVNNNTSPSIGRRNHVNSVPGTTTRV